MGVANSTCKARAIVEKQLTILDGLQSGRSSGELFLKAFCLDGSIAPLHGKKTILQDLPLCRIAVFDAAQWKAQ